MLKSSLLFLILLCHAMILFHMCNHDIWNLVINMCFRWKRAAGLFQINEGPVHQADKGQVWPGGTATERQAEVPCGYLALCRALQGQK